MKFISGLLVLCLLAGPLFALETEISSQEASIATVEALSTPTSEVKAPNYWTEFDITFWQTMPWAAFWGCVIDRNLVNAWIPSGQPHWDAILVVATVISIVNANWHANTVMDNVRERNSKQINFWQRR